MQLREWERGRQKDIEDVHGLPAEFTAACSENSASMAPKKTYQHAKYSLNGGSYLNACMQLREWGRGRQKDIEDVKALGSQCSKSLYSWQGRGGRRSSDVASSCWN